MENQFHRQNHTGFILNLGHYNLRKLWKSSSSTEKNRNVSSKMATFAKRLSATTTSNRGRIASKILQQQQKQTKKL